MKTVTEWKAIPRIRISFPAAKCAIARLKLKSTKHRQMARIVLSWHNGFDVVTIAFKFTKVPTPEEIQEVIQLFFKAEEVDQCRVTQHPDFERVALIYRQQI